MGFEIKSNSAELSNLEPKRHAETIEQSEMPLPEAQAILAEAVGLEPAMDKKQVEQKIEQAISGGLLQSIGENKLLNKALKVLILSFGLSMSEKAFSQTPAVNEPGKDPIEQLSLATPDSSSEGKALNLPDVEKIAMPDFLTEQEKGYLKEYYNYELNTIKEIERQFAVWQAKYGNREGFVLFKEAVEKKISNLIKDFNEGVVEISQDTTKFLVNKFNGSNEYNVFKRDKDGNVEHFSPSNIAGAVDTKLRLIEGELEFKIRNFEEQDVDEAEVRSFYKE